MTQKNKFTRKKIRKVLFYVSLDFRLISRRIILNVIGVLWQIKLRNTGQCLLFKEIPYNTLTVMHFEYHFPSSFLSYDGS